MPEVREPSLRERLGFDTENMARQIVDNDPRVKRARSTVKKELEKATAGILRRGVKF